MQIFLKHKKLFLILFIAVFILFLFFIFTKYKNYGISWDEQVYLSYGKRYFENYLNLRKIEKNFELSHVFVHGALFDIGYYLPLQLLNQTGNFALLHLEKALFSSLTLVFVFFTLRLLTKNYFIALIGVLFMITTPRWLGDIFDNHMDGISTVLYSALIFISIKLLQDSNRKISSKLFVTFSILSALAFSHRIILFFIPCLTLLLIFLSQLKKNKISHLFKYLIGYIVLFAITLLIVDPALRVYGISGFWQKIFYSLKYTYGRTNLFNGVFMDARHLPWNYLPIWIGITTPVVTLLLFFFGLVTLRVTNRNKVVSTFLLGSLFMPILFTIILRPVLYDAWRQFLFLVVPLNIIAALGAGQLLKKKLAILVLLVILVGTSSTFLAMSKLHPYEYAYFNSLVGGLRGAYGKYDTDYWGKSYKEAVEWLKSNEIKDSKKIYRIFACDNTFSSSYYFVKNMKLEKDLAKADYAVCFTRWNDDKKIRGKIIHVVERDGVPLNFVKKLR